MPPSIVRAAGFEVNEFGSLIMNRRNVLVAFGALALASAGVVGFGASRAETSKAVKAACACCGAACACPACICDASVASKGSCDCCGGASCCTASAGETADCTIVVH